MRIRVRKILHHCHGLLHWLPEGRERRVNGQDKQKMKQQRGTVVRKGLHGELQFLGEFCEDTVSNTHGVRQKIAVLCSADPLHISNQQQPYVTLRAQSECKKREIASLDLGISALLTGSSNSGPCCSDGLGFS